MTWFEMVLFAVWAIGLVIALTLLERRRRHNGPLKAWVQSQPITFAAGAHVRKRANGGVGWVDFKSPSGVRFLIRGEGIEVSLAPPMDRILDTAEYLKAATTTMWIDRIGWAGSPIAKRDCIRLDAVDLNGKVELAVSPVDASVDDAWNALVRAGVTPFAGQPPRD